MQVKEFEVLSQKLKAKAIEALNANDFESAKVYINEICDTELN